MLRIKVVRQEQPSNDEQPISGVFALRNPRSDMHLMASASRWPSVRRCRALFRKLSHSAIAEKWRPDSHSLSGALGHKWRVQPKPLWRLVEGIITVQPA